MCSLPTSFILNPKTCSLTVLRWLEREKLFFYHWSLKSVLIRQTLVNERTYFWSAARNLSCINVRWRTDDPDPTQTKLFSYHWSLNIMLIPYQFLLKKLPISQRENSACMIGRWTYLCFQVRNLMLLMPCQQDFLFQFSLKNCLFACNRSSWLLLSTIHQWGPYIVERIYKSLGD